MTTVNINVSNGSNDKDVEFNSWVDSMEMMLGCVDNPIVQASSISFVPDQLRKSKVEAYMPKKVSIGPLHRGSSPDLIYMEDIKWRCMKELLCRTENEMESLKVCSEAILDLDEILCSSYNVDDIKFKSYDLAKILLLDGCFLLQLLISGSVESNGITEKEVVLSDLIVHGNQIPFIILCKLAALLFPDDFPDQENGILQDEAEMKIKKSILSILGYSSGSTNYFRPVHVLGLVHSFITQETKDVDENPESEHWPINMEKSKGEEMRQLKLKRCAIMLEVVGVTIKPPEGKSEPPDAHEEIRFDLKIKFREGKLEIPPLHITKTTEAKWRNFIAWELTRSPNSKSIVRHNGMGCKFIWYALFFQGLICSVHDIQLLRDKDVIVVHDVERDSLDREGKKKKKMNNEELLTFFHNIIEGVHDDQIVNDNQFCKLFEDLNSHPTHLCSVTVKSRIILHFCRRVLTGIWCFCKKSFKMLRRDHITTRWQLVLAVIAFVVFACTFIKTFFPHLIH